MDALRSILTDMCCGLRDAIFGMFKIYKLDQVTPTPPRKVPERKTVLAQRREAGKRTQHDPIPVSPPSPKTGSPKVIKMVIQCCAWNGGIFWLSIVIFNHLLLPYLRIMTEFIFGSEGNHNVIWQWVGPILSYMFGALWILPLFVLSKIVNSFWFQDIADTTYRQSRGRPQLPNISQFIADFVFSTFLQAIFLIQAMVTKFVPIIGVVVSFIHLCLLYSLYAFEYKWFNMGWGVHKRLEYIESNWAYFCGFGLPLATLSALPSSYVISGCVFGILFPLCIVSANEARQLAHLSVFPIHFFGIAVGATNIIFHQTVEKWFNTTQSRSTNRSPSSSQSVQSTRFSPSHSPSPRSSSMSSTHSQSTRR